ncbi:MAG: hypothetical protein J6Y62_04080 [Clostridia bacterium]|nr:hypothetical protein [Clostridia bacterium]
MILSLWLYNKNGEVRVSEKPAAGYEEARFGLEEPDCESWSQMEMECLVKIQINPRMSLSRYDLPRMKRWLVRKCLKWWSFDRPLSFENGVLDDASLETVMSLHPRILSRLTAAMQRPSLTDEDRNDLARQAALLFGKAGTVSNAHPLLSLYITLEDMWQKFGLNYFDLQRLPLSLKDGLREIMSLEGQVKAAARKSAAPDIDEGMMKRLGLK